MGTVESVFCDAFYRWWRDQTIPHKMTLDKARKIFADCQAALEPKLVPQRMTLEAFLEYLEAAKKVILFGVSWQEATTKSVEELTKERRGTLP